MKKIKSPVPLSQNHVVDEFNSGELSLDDWLKRRGLKNQASGASRCFVICNEINEVIGYYTLSAGAIALESTPKKLRRNMPDPLPILLLGRLAIDKQYQNQGIGTALLRDAMLRALNVSSDAGIVAILIHALSEMAKRFYLSRGFMESPIQPMTLMMPIQAIKSVVNDLNI